MNEIIILKNKISKKLKARNIIICIIDAIAKCILNFKKTCEVNVEF